MSVSRDTEKLLLLRRFDTVAPPKAVDMRHDRLVDTPVSCWRKSPTSVVPSVRVHDGSCHCCSRVSSHWSKRLSSCWRRVLHCFLARTSSNEITSAAPKGESSCGRMK